jgi:hypothetical protein
MENYEIIKGIPVPARSKYPFAEMEIGDSFVKNCCSQQHRNLLSMTASMWGRRHGRRFRTRKEDGDNVRVWRIQ